MRVVIAILTLLIATAAYAKDPEQLKGEAKLEAENLKLKAQVLDLQLRPLMQESQQLDAAAAEMAKKLCGKDDRVLDWPTLACVDKPAPKPTPAQETVNPDAAQLAN